MALKDEPEKGKRRGVIVSDGEVPKLSPDNDEDTSTAIETPFARENVKDEDGKERTSRPSDDGKVDDAKTRSAKTDPPAQRARGAPARGHDDGRPDSLAPFLVPVYVAALALLFVGERVVPGDPVLRYAFSGAGVLGAVATTLYRLRAMARAGDERRSVEKIFAALMAGGLVAVAIYFATTEAGRNLIGAAEWKPDTLARVTGIATVTWVTLLLVSVLPLIFGELALAPMRRAERIEARRVRASTLAGMTLALAATYVALFSYASGELDKKLDFSYFRTSRPGESTRNVAASLSEPLEVLAFFPQLNDVGEEVKGYLAELSQASPQIQVKFQDRLLVPALAKETKVVQDGVLVLQRGTTRETLVIGAEMKGAQAKLKTLDADFQKALLKVARPQRIAYFTAGHGELNDLTGAAAAEGRSAKNIKKLFESQNYVVKDLGVPQGLAADVPQDAHIVLMLGPSQALLPEEIAALKRYAERGGRLILALDPDGKIDLAPVAAMVDLTWKPAVLATDDPRHYYPLRHNDSDRVIMFTNRFSSHASVSSLSKVSQKNAVAFRGAAAIDKADGATAKIDFAVRALNETFDDQNGNFAFDKDSEKRSGYGLAAAVTRPVAGGEKGKDGKEKEMRAFVLGDADALSDGVVGDTPNGLLALDVIRWLGGDESFFGAVTSNEDVKIEHTKQKDSVWFYGTIFAVPLAVLGIGFVATRRRKSGARRAA